VEQAGSQLSQAYEVLCTLELVNADLEAEVQGLVCQVSLVMECFAFPQSPGCNSGCGCSCGCAGSHAWGDPHYPAMHLTPTNLGSLSNASACGRYWSFYSCFCSCSMDGNTCTIHSSVLTNLWSLTVACFRRCWSC